MLIYIVIETVFPGEFGQYTALEHMTLVLEVKQ